MGPTLVQAVTRTNLETSEAGSREELSFLSNSYAHACSPGNRLPGEGAHWLEEHGDSVMSGAPTTTLENPKEKLACAPRRTHNRSRSPR